MAVIKSKNAKNLRIQVTTNGTILPQAFLDYADKVQDARILFSIDGVADRGSYVRSSLNWQDFDDNVKIKMKYPSLQEFVDNNFDFSKPNSSEETIDRSFEIVSSCVDMVYTKDECLSASDLTKKELVEWLQTFDSNQFKGIENFFDTMPKLSHTLVVKNPKTGVESDIVLEGLSSFFG